MDNFYGEKIKISYEKVDILKEVDITIPMNKITIIIGPNGCGKSTLLKSLSRIIKYQGNVFLNGLDIQKLHTKELAKKIAILSQSPEIMNGFKVEELISYGRFPYLKPLENLSKKDKEIIDWAIKITGIDEYRNKKIENLSGGQRQRVWIAMSLAQETPIIFLDEPTTYLDLAHQLEVLELLDKLNKEEKRTIVMVLHDLNHASKFADYIIAMKKGIIIKKGTPKEVITNENLKEIFNIDAKIEIDLEANKPICIDYKLIKDVNKKSKKLYF